MTPSSGRGVLNDAISIHLADATIANAFVGRWCIGHRAETTDGVFRIREDDPPQRVIDGSPWDVTLRRNAIRALV